MRTKRVVMAVLTLSSVAGAETFHWTVDPSQSVLTTTISATIGSTISDSETNQVAGFLSGSLRLPSYSFGTIHLRDADLAYTSDPSFSLTQPFFGGVTIAGSGLGLAIPGASGLGYASSTPASVDLAGAFNQTGNGVEGRGTLTYTGVGILGAGLGTDTLNLLDQSPLPLDFPGTLIQIGNQLRLALPVSIDQTSIQNGIPVRVQISGTVRASAATSANGWKADANGSWSTASNWVAGDSVPGAPASSFDTAVFGDFLNSQERTIAVDAAVAPRRVLVDAGAGSYRFTGSAPISIASGIGSGISVLSGEARFDNPVVLAAPATLAVDAMAKLRMDRLSAGAGSATHKTGAGALILREADIGSLQVEEGSVAFTGAAEARVTSLAIATGARVAVTDTLIIEDQPGGVGEVTALLAESAGGGLRPGSTGVLGIGTRASTGWSSLSGFPLSDSSIIVRTTLAGDANLDRHVDFADLLALAQHYGSVGAWFDGDFDYDADVDFADLLALAQQYGGSLTRQQQEQLETRFAAEFLLARSVVPEPTLALLILATSGRRRRPLDIETGRNR